MANWNPDALVDIRGYAQEGEIQCYTIGNKRCGWRCPWKKENGDADNAEVQRQLPILGRKPASSYSPKPHRAS